MKVTQSKKTGKFSLTQLEKSDLVNLHNTLSDYALKSQIRLALLDLMSGEERVKLQTEEAVNEYFESEGLVLKSSKAVLNGSNGSGSNNFVNDNTKEVTALTFPATQATLEESDRQSPNEDVEEESVNDEEETEEEELPL